MPGNYYSGPAQNIMHVHISDSIEKMKFSYADTLSCYISLLRVVKIFSSLNR
jgi:hypothetical protein